MGAHKSKFIVLEGIDGSGTTTQAQLLGEELSRLGYNVVVTREPYDTMVTRRIRDWLQNDQPPYQALLLAFALDRHIHLNDVVLPALARGDIVVCDRYIASTLVYQSKHNDPALVKELCSGLLQPDLYIHLDIDADMAAARMAARSATSDAYERNRELQHELAADYREVLSDNSVPVATVRNEDLTILQVHKKVMNAVTEVLAL